VSRLLSRFGSRLRRRRPIGPSGRRATVLETLAPRWDAPTTVLRLLVLVLPLVATWSTVPLGATPSTWTIPTTTLAALLWAIWPGSSTGTFALGLPILWWATGPADAMSPWALLAAACLLAAHVCAHLASVGPPDLPFDPALARLWLGRSLLVLPVAPLIYVVAILTTGADQPTWGWVAGMAGACCLFATAQWALRDETRS